VGHTVQLGGLSQNPCQPPLTSASFQNCKTALTPHIMVLMNIDLSLTVENQLSKLSCPGFDIVKERIREENTQ